MLGLVSSATQDCRKPTQVTRREIATTLELKFDWKWRKVWLVAAVVLSRGLWSVSVSVRSPPVKLSPDMNVWLCEGVTTPSWQN